jgi:hypothetical protein
MKALADCNISPDAVTLPTTDTRSTGVKETEAKLEPDPSATEKLKVPSAFGVIVHPGGLAEAY